MLVFWSNESKDKLLKAVGHVFQSYPGTPWKHVSDLSQIPAGPDVQAIVCFGAETLEKLVALGLVHKGRTINSLRGVPVALPETTSKAFITYSPNIGQVDHAKYVQMVIDVMQAMRYVATGSLEPDLSNVDYQYVSDLKSVRKDIEGMLETTTGLIPVGLDTETLGLDEFNPSAYIVSIQVSYKPGLARVIHFKSQAVEQEWIHTLDNVADLAWLLNEPRLSLRGANLKYDLRWIHRRLGLECTNFRFDTTIVGSLLDENRSNGLDVHAKLYTPMGGYCVAPATKVWKRDLTWAEAGDIQVGDELVGFDEHPAPGQRRKMLPSKVLSRQDLDLRCYRLTFSNGREVVVSDNHAWLVHPGTNGGNLKWVQTEKLKLGTRMKAVTEVVLPLRDYDSGWVAGFLDGEGHVTSPSTGSRFELGWAQKPGIVWDRASALIAGVTEFYTWNGKSSGVLQAKVATHAALKVLQAFRPFRLLAKEKWIGAALPQEPEHVILVKKELVGTHPVVSLKTTTATFVAEGLASHNSDTFDRTVDKSRMDLLPPDDKFLVYAGGDADATLRVSEVEKTLLAAESKPLFRFYVNLLHPAARTFEIVERGGIFVDREEFRKLDADLEADMLRLTKEAKAMLGGRIVAKHLDDSKTGGLNLTKASLLEDFLFSPMGLNLKPQELTAKTKKPSTSLDHLMKFSSHPVAGPFVKLLSEFSSTQKTRSTYVTGFLHHLRSDGRFHPHYYLFVGSKEDNEGGTNTGRLSCRDPAFQCLDGATSVYNKDGWSPIRTLVENFESGKSIEVLTHTGKWQPVVGVFRNGVKPVFKITTASGKVIRCTGNHPWLTLNGFIRADRLRTGDKVWKFNEDSIGECRRQSESLEDSGRFGNREQRASTISSSVRVWDGKNPSCLQSDWQEAEQILWLLQESAADYSWTCEERGGIQDLLVLAAHDWTVLRSKRQGVQELWSPGDYRLRFLERFIREFSQRYGREACWSILREIGSEWELRCNQLHLGNPLPTGKKPPQQFLDRDQWPEKTFERSGTRSWHSSRHSVYSFDERVELDSSPYHACQAQKAGYQEDVIVSIVEDGEAETFDLTIQDSHSFVANGLVVHNTIPKHTKWAKRIRRCYPAPPGMLVVERDFSQGELKIVACLANEENMIQAYLNNMDLHVMTSGRFRGYTYEDMMALKVSDPDMFDAIRQLGKAGNFGLIYGMGEEGFEIYAETNYGVKLAPGEAGKFRDGFFQSYPGLLTYHKAYKEFARKNGYVMSPLGRVRHLPLINSFSQQERSKEERRAVNAPVQSALSDMLVLAMSLSVKQGWHFQMPPMGAVHDAAYNYVLEDNYVMYVKREVELMENLPLHEFGWKPRLQFTADAKVGPNMADLKKVSFH